MALGWRGRGVFAFLVALTSLPPSAEADIEPEVPDEIVVWRAAVTSYYMFNAHRVTGTYNALQYPYADSHGFGLVFLAGGFRFETQRWGIMLDLKYGQNIGRLTELTPVSRAFVTWIPVARDKLKLDLGYFGAFVGIETDDEWRNPTFTRGVIYFRMQPFRHLGLRATGTPHEDVRLRLIVASGSMFGTQFPDGNPSNVIAPTVGAQVEYQALDELNLKLGAVTSPNGLNGNRDWQAIIDFIVEWDDGPGNVFVDIDYQFASRGTLTGRPASRQWGVSLGGGYEINDYWKLGFRGEYFGAEGNGESLYVFTFTGTVRYTPIQYLIISLEPRGELSDNAIYFGRPLTTDPTTGATTASLNKDWFFGFWIGITAYIGN